MKELSARLGRRQEAKRRARSRSQVSGEGEVTADLAVAASPRTASAQRQSKFRPDRPSAPPMPGSSHRRQIFDSLSDVFLFSCLFSFYPHSTTQGRLAERERKLVL